jgi:hypothetical protein
MTSDLHRLADYNAMDGVKRLSLRNARPKSIPFEALPIAQDTTQSALITIGDYPFLLNQLQLGSISDSGTTLPQAFFMSFNLYDQNNLSLFGGVAPRASSVFGWPVLVEYAIQPVKVCPPRSRLKLEWTNHNSITGASLSFEMFLNGIEVITKLPKEESDDAMDILDELLEKRTR